jgi:uncharacterized membrane protein
MLRDFVKNIFSKHLHYLVAIIALVGLLDSLYLTYQHFTFKSIEVCPIFGGCNEVLISKYSEIFDIPTAFFGVLFYSGVIVFTMLFIKLRQVLYVKLLMAITTFGFLFTLWLVYLQLFVINAICFYCMISAVTSTTLFVFAILLYKLGLHSRSQIE